MRLGIHARELTGVGGTNTYVRNVLEHLPGPESKFEFTILYTGKKPVELAAEHIQLIKNPTDRPILSDHLVVPYLTQKYNLDCVWFPKNVCPVLYRGRSVITVHDLGYFVQSDYYPLADRVYMRRMINYSCKKADRIIAISENTKRDIIEYTGADASKIEVIYSGVDEMFWEPCETDDIQDFLYDYNLEQPIIYGGNIGERKNNDILIASFDRLNLDATLVFTGKEPNEKIQAQINEAQDVRYLGYVDNYEIKVLYNIAKLFVYPSDYEGFGLPPLEAMACGTPVITSNSSSLPEVVGDAAVTVPPSDVTALASEIETVFSNSEKQAEMIASGKDRAQQFTWKDTTHEMMAVFKEFRE